MSIEKHLSAIRSGEITKTNLIGIRKALNTASRIGQGYSPSSTAPKVTPRDAIALETALETTEPRVMGELHETGVKVLRNPRYRKRWNEKQAGIIARLDHFALIRFDYIGRNGFHCVPVFRTVDVTGQSFCFRNIP